MKMIIEIIVMPEWKQKLFVIVIYIAQLINNYIGCLQLPSVL